MDKKRKGISKPSLIKNFTDTPVSYTHLNTNKAFHLIQAFSPGEVSYEEAHQIGKELADRLLEGKYSYVLTTHTDKGHLAFLGDTQ